MSETKEWKGVMIGCHDPFDTYHEVPGWECPECGHRLGMVDYPNFPCPRCGFKQRGDQRCPSTSS